MPERRRSLYGDAEYDWEHNANTTSGGVGQRTRLLAAISGAPYQPTEPGLFAEMMSALPIEFAEFTFIDIGSGKGRTLLMADKYSFRRIIGVELLPELHKIAQGNAADRPRIETMCLDARDFHFPDDPLVLYLFNPLPAGALKTVVENLHTSLLKVDRPAWIIYHNPISESVLSETAFLYRVSGTQQYVIYSN